MRILLFVLTVFTSLPSMCQEYTDFMGVSMDKGMDVIGKKLIENGFESVLSDSEFDGYVGTFLGFKNCLVLINKDDKTHNIKDIVVSISAENNDTISSLKGFLKAYSFLENTFALVDMRLGSKTYEPFNSSLIKVLFDDRVLLYFNKDIDEVNGDIKYKPTITYYPLPLGVSRTEEEINK